MGFRKKFRYQYFETNPTVNRYFQKKVIVISVFCHPVCPPLPQKSAKCAAGELICLCLESRSIAANVNDEAESVEVAKRKSKPNQWWVHYQLDELEKKHSSCNKKIVRKSSTIEGMMCLYKNIEAVRDQMQPLGDIFKLRRSIIG